MATKCEYEPHELSFYTTWWLTRSPSPSSSSALSHRMILSNANRAVPFDDTHHRKEVNIDRICDKSKDEALFSFRHQPKLR